MIGISNIISQGFSAFQERFDGIQNLLTGQGVGKYDPTQGSYVLPRRFLNQQEQSNIMQYGLMRKIVFKIPEGATAKWGRPTLTKGDPKTIAAISKALEDLQVIVPGNLPTTGADNAFLRHCGGRFNQAMVRS